jgi:hypothetical protein
LEQLQLTDGCQATAKGLEQLQPTDVVQRIFVIKHALTGLQGIASTQGMTANICTPMLLEVLMSLS